MTSRRFTTFAIFAAWLLVPNGWSSAEEATSSTAKSAPLRIVCFGDSITKRGYPAILAEILGVEAINAGVAGHTSAQGLHRMQTDVLNKKPDVVVIFFGTNDLRVDAEKCVPVVKYKENLETMIDACRKQQADVVLCTLPPIDPNKYFLRHQRESFDAVGGLPHLITQYQKTAIQVAAEHDVALVDLQKVLKQDPNWISHDGVHPNKEGCELIAKQIAQAVASLPQIGALIDKASDLEKAN
ncbi:Arylesterase precursor [Planctomycetes bacterium CA13]|uniref:Arylesterase n=1 Tax=Novipirellula herctigrandis TaxID=2527986 RepID=A0A5C5YXL3_9BACT|nr:Arylesterase precursor [Planctomycetes bacterium CA13]